MGRIAGIYYFSRRPAPPDDDRWIRRLFVQESPVYETAGVLSGADEECRQFVSPEGSVCAWDGRLDNRADLAGEQLTDAALALRAYQARGANGLRDVIGDWSLAIWDAASAAIILASDFAGIRPLYYFQSPEFVAWSSCLAHLVEQVRPAGLDEEYVASLLSRGMAPFRTPYPGVFPVPPGQAVVVTAGRTTTHAFWSLPIGRETRFPHPREYEERLHSLFEEAVRVRLPPDSPVCAELSGGLDSSSVVLMASRLLSAHGRKPVTFSYVYEGSTDRKYIELVERVCHNPGVHLELENYPFLTADRAGTAAPCPWAPRFDELARRMAADGSRVFLTGQLGDFVMGASADDTDQIAGHLRDGQWIQGMREAFAWSQSMRVPIYPLLFRAVKASFSSRTSQPAREEDSLAPAFRKRISLDEIDRLGRTGWQDAPPGKRRRFRSLSGMLEARVLQAPAPMQHISFTHPFAHRPLVEFMLTIPPGELCRPGEPRRLMRRAFAELLPAPILCRKSKAVYTEVYRQAIVPLAAEFLKNPSRMRLVELGYVDLVSVTKRLNRLVQGLNCNESQLRQLILLETWLRSREKPAGRSPASLELSA